MNEAVTEYRDFIPAGMRTARRWGVVKSDKTPYRGGAPGWCKDFEAAVILRDDLIERDNGVHKRVLGYCFGGVSKSITDAAVDPDHGNLTDEEAAKLGKPVGALYMRPDPRYGCIDYDHVIDPNTRELRQDLPENLAAEITTITRAWPTEVSASGTGLHVIFEKREGWPQFTKIKQTFGDFGREVFSGKGYVNFTGDRWKDQRPAPTQEQADAAYGLLLGIVNDYLCKNGNRTTKDAVVKNPELTRELTTEEQKILKTWMKIEADKVAIQMTREKIGYKSESEASEAMMSVMTRIAGDAAEDAHKHGMPYEAYARPKIIRWLWEQSKPYRELYASGKHDYNESKITTTIEKARDAGRQKYNELSKTTGKTREKTHGKAKKAEEEPPAEQPEYTPEQAAEARRIWEEGRMLQYLRNSIHKEHTGDDHIVDAMILSAACIYVQNSDGIHISVSGETGSGKSHVAETVAARMPPKMVLSGGLSDKALYYLDIPNGTVIILDDQSMSDELQEVMKTGTTGWKKPAKYHTVGKVNGKNTAITLTLPTHSPWWVIKKNITGDEQVMDRMLVLHTDDSPEQRHAILNKILHESNKEPDTSIEKALWDYLEPVTVDIPYINHIGFEDTMNPRNLNLFLDILKANAVLHTHQRARDGDVIYASRDDFDAAIALFRPLMHGKGGSQTLKITHGQQQVLDYLFDNKIDVISRVDLQTALGICDRTLRDYLKGRDERGYGSLYAVCPALSPTPYADKNDPTRRLKGVVFRRDQYARWKDTVETGVYWID